MYFVMIGLMCNSLGCYWATMDEHGKERHFTEQTQCSVAAEAIRSRSIMYFQSSCLVRSDTP